MKTTALNLLFIGFCFFVSIQLKAQVPQAFNYQVVVRDAAGSIMPNRTVGFRINLIEGGTLLYSERHLTQTNEFGLVNLVIGEGTALSGSMAGINWPAGQYFLRIEMDPNGGTNYYLMGTSQLQSVPFALRAKTVELDHVDDADADPQNEIQELQLSGTQLTLTRGGGTVTLPSTGSGDNWGTQTVVTDATMAGNGTTAAPLRISQNGAASGQALKWNGTTWAPADDNAGVLTLPYSGYGTSDTPLFNFINQGYGAAVSAISSGIFAIRAESSHNSGIGVYGANRTTTGTTYGIYGDVHSPNGFSGYFQGGKVFIQGNTGIGTDSPTTKLEVNGQVKITGGSPGAGKVLTSDASGLASWATPASSPWTKSGSSLFYTDGNVGIGTSSPINRLTIYANDQSAANFLNSGSGTNPLDGFFVGITHGGSTPPAWIWNYENSNMYFGTNNAYRMVINADGQVDVKGLLNINSDVPDGQALWVYGKEALWFNGTYFSWGYDATFNYFADPITIGNITEPTGYMLWVQGDAWATGYWLRSDARFKKNILPIDNALNRLMQIHGSTFEFRKNESAGSRISEGLQYGLIAQDIEPVFPELVKTDEDGYKSVNYNGMIPVLIEALKEQQSVINKLRTENDQLKSEQEKVMARLEKLEYHMFILNSKPLK